ncbi:hypothetical protein FRB94_009351 [Tulasnella sp. JGI-2019a]|nr:hypothetical protein FRB93_003706 [Tulasnella sp. JGI-2019a]KAG8995213.1 hypothetical protein FRB94_009351 [Tulasnella sp. JGI-2019a]KAG9030607.1 hypothetical protein FRB95_003806 [Tulasnella sp. JGI-2019a]
MSSAVRLANNAGVDALLPDTFCTRRQIKSVDYDFVVRKASDVPPKTRRDVWAIFEGNMRAAYTSSSFGWHPPSKRKELFDPLSRFILVYAPASKARSGTSLVGFVMFRFDEEETMEEDDSMEDVVYCYEIQISRKVQRSGLGVTLLEDLQKIAKKWRMKKVMLTVFKTNKPAIELYTKLGYTIDPISPSEVLRTRSLAPPVSSGDQTVEATESEDDWEDDDDDVEEVDYEIYSQVVQ